MKTFILGGVRSGKSRLAENYAMESNKPVIYIATASPDDAEMEDRIGKHKKNRPKSWTIIEEPLNLGKVLRECSNSNSCIIIDCLTLWVTNLLLYKEGKLLAELREDFLDFLNTSNNHLYIVSNETGLGIMPLGELTRKFGDEAGITNQAVAKSSDRVVFMVAGLPMTLK